jgi:NAD(P)-dependent dehydrogenase (short-subunit alcohol dehydrogenase family)
MPSVLITGANRGLGLEFARQYAAAGWRVHAACRDPAAASALAALPGEISRHRLDLHQGRDQHVMAACAQCRGGAFAIGLRAGNGEAHVIIFPCA